MHSVMKGKIKNTVRNTLVVAAMIITAPIWILVRFGEPIGFNCFETWGKLFSLLPGEIGVFLRRGYYVMTLEKFAWDCGIDFGTWFSKRNVIIEPRVSIGANCIIGMCRIGEGTLIGSNIDILSGRKQHGSNELCVSKESQNVFTEVNIGKNIWIGNRSIIMADVGENSIIGAGSIVIRAIPSNAVAAGNPAVVKNKVLAK